MRDTIQAALTAAMRDKNQLRLATLRLINAAIKDRDIAARSEGNGAPVDEASILALLGKMIKQREESARLYEEGGRLELAERERAEAEIIREFLPAPMGPDEVDRAISDAISEIGAAGIRDMGRVMALLKGRYAGRMDFGSVGGQVKNALS